MSRFLLYIDNSFQIMDFKGKLATKVAVSSSFYGVQMLVQMKVTSIFFSKSTYIFIFVNDFSCKSSKFNFWR